MLEAQTCFVSYLRVSTERQGAAGLGIEAQREAIDRFVQLSRGQLETELVEVESGKRANRPILEEAIRLCRRKGATLLVAKLDRLSRTVSFMSRLIETGVDFIAVDNPHANKLLIHVLAAFAEHERDLIAARTRAALSAARQRGVALGNPRLADARVSAAEAIRRNADRYCANVGPIIAELRTSGLSTLSELARTLRARGIPTARGGNWHAATVRNVEGRYRTLCLTRVGATSCNGPDLLPRGLKRAHSSKTNHSTRD